MTNKEREDKISFLINRMKTTRDRDLIKADSELVIILINQRPADYVADMEREMGLSA